MIDYKIKIIVSGKNSDNCSLKNNCVYEVNINDKDFICPASFHVVYPYLMLAGKGSYIDWDNSSLSFRVPCPDCVGTVYKIDRQANGTSYKEVLT